MAIITRGFVGRRSAIPPERVPPGQWVTRDFPVLSAGPTPRTPLARWDFQVTGAVGHSRRWTWAEFQTLPRMERTVDIHCVTTWTKLDTRWSGVAIDTLLDGIEPLGAYVTAFCDGGYTTNVPLADLVNGRAMIADTYAGEPLEAEHGGPARLLVPHLYFWKSAKWVRGLEVTIDDRPGFWEEQGYHDRGDPWTEQRYRSP